MKDRWRTGTFLALLLLLLTMAFPAWAAEETESAIGLEVAYGYQGTAKSGRFLPLRITLTNKESEDFAGTIQIVSMESDYEIYRYDYPAEVPAQGELTRVLSISLGSRIDQMYVEIVGEDGNLLARQQLKLNSSEDTTELFIGVLSDHPDQLHYLNGVGINYGALQTRTVEMTGKTLPSQDMGLDQLDMLLISDFNTKTLSQEQINTIWDWTQRGGVLLFGTGSRGEETLGAFEERLLDGPLPQSENLDINMGVAYATDSPQGATIPLECTQVFLKDANEILASDELSVVTSAGVGNGLAVAAIYDFGSVGEFCREHISYIDDLFTAILGEEKLTELSSVSDGGLTNRYWSIQSLISSGDASRLPRISFYAACAAAYVLFVGPGLYFFLKQRELQQLYGRSVLLLSLCGVVLIYFMGIGTRFKGPFMTYASIKDVTAEEISETAFINLCSPYNQAYSVSLDSSYEVYPVTRSAYYDMKPLPIFTGEEKPSVTLDFLPEETRIRLEDTGAFRARYFELEQKRDNADQVGFTGEIHFFGGQINGTLTSHFSQTIEDAAVLLHNQMVLIDELQPGETVTLDGREVIYGIMTYDYAMADQVTGASRHQETQAGDNAALQAMERGNLLSFYMNNYLKGYHPEARIVGFIQEDQGANILQSQNLETYGSTLITSSLDVDYEQGDLVYRSALRKAPDVLGGEYHSATNTMYSAVPVVLEYYLGSDISIEQVDFHSLSENVVESLWYSYISPFAGGVYFYNYDTGSYDLMEKEELSFNREELDPYLSPGNTLTVKYVCSNTDDYSRNNILPIVMVTGRSS